MRGIRLGKILGLEIRIDYSWFVIFFLILWSFTFGVFPARSPGLPQVTYVGMGFAGAILFFASLLAHELSHSIVARRRGVPVEGITLFVFGGIAHMRTEAQRPGDEFAIAVVGPLASLVLGVLFAVLAWLGGALGWSATVTPVAAQLAFLNFLLAVFNLLPGFPLDGGRVFRAAVWRATGDLTRATRWATIGGRTLGYMLMGLGLAEIFLTASLLGGMWLIFIGWFVRTLADASLRQHIMRQWLEGVTVGELMTPNPQTVAAELPLTEFVDHYILSGRHRAYPVTDDGRPVGFITLDRFKSIPREAWSQRTVGDVMSTLTDDMLVREHDRMSSVLDRLATSANNGRLVVMHDGHIRGVLTRADLARWLEAAELRGAGEGKENTDVTGARRRPRPPDPLVR